MNELPPEFGVVRDRLAGLGWQLDRLHVQPSPKQGYNNKIYVVRHEDQKAVVRLPKDPPRAASSYDREAHNIICAAESGVTPRPLLSDPSDGLLVLPFLPGTHPRPDRIGPAGAVRFGRCLRRLHRETRPFHKGREPFRRYRRRMARVLSEADGARHHAPGLVAAARAAEPLVEVLARTAPPPTPCHFDIVLENIIDDGKAAHLIDWEMSTQGDPHQDMGAFSAIARLKDKARQAFIETCLDGDSAAEVEWAQARVALWEPLCALNLAYFHWRFGLRTDSIDTRTQYWTRRFWSGLAAPGTRAAFLFLETSYGAGDDLAQP